MPEPGAGLDVQPTQTASKKGVPGNNNCTYGPVPKEDQLFSVEYFEIAPLPILADRVIFGLLRGWVPESARKGLKEEDPEHPGSLTSATLSITVSAVLANGKRDEPRTHMVPLRTTAFADTAHLSIRNAKGGYTDYLTGSSLNEILFDYCIPGMFLKTGTWTFQVVARLGDGRSLFAMSLTQWLEGRLSV